MHYKYLLRANSLLPFNTNSFSYYVSFIPILQLCLVMGIDATCNDDSLLTGKQVVSLLPNICLGAIEAFLCLLGKFLKQESNSMPKGAISSAVKKARMSSSYKGLDDILTALRKTSLPNLPSGKYLMYASICYPPQKGVNCLILVQGS